MSVPTSSRRFTESNQEALVAIGCQRDSCLYSDRWYSRTTTEITKDTRNVLLLFSITAGVLACGGGGSRVRNLGTTGGTYTITVTGTAAPLTKTGSVTLTVQ